MSPEGLIRLVENPGAGTSSSLKLAGFSKAEHASRQHSMMSQQKRVPGSQPTTA